MRESTIRDILVSYERKRDKAESELEAREEKMYIHKFLKLKN